MSNPSWLNLAHSGLLPHLFSQCHPPGMPLLSPCGKHPSLQPAQNAPCPFPLPTPREPLPEPCSHPNEIICLHVHFPHWAAPSLRQRAGQGWLNPGPLAGLTWGWWESDEKCGNLRPALNPGRAPSWLCGWEPVISQAGHPLCELGVTAAAGTPSEGCSESQ